MGTPAQNYIASVLSKPPTKVYIPPFRFGVGGNGRGGSWSTSPNHSHRSYRTVWCTRVDSFQVYGHILRRHMKGATEEESTNAEIAQYAIDDRGFRCHRSFVVRPSPSFLILVGPTGCWYFRAQERADRNSPPEYPSYEL